jgi:putative SOS response-associated peptidase YedK
MCSNYRPVTRMDRLLTFFGVEYGKDEAERDVYPLGDAPFIRLSADGQAGGRPALVAETGMFGLLEHWCELKHGRRTYNARSETVARLPTYRGPWKKGQRCVIPAEAIFEPCFETGRAVRWRIFQQGDVPMGIAGIYNEWKAPDGTPQFTFSMLTVNAGGHPLMQRMHRPEEEKRMVVILDPKDYGPWLDASVGEAPSFFRQWAGELLGEPDAVQRGSRSKDVGEAPPAATPPPEAALPPQRKPPPPVQGDLF